MLRAMHVVTSLLAAPLLFATPHVVAAPDSLQLARLDAAPAREARGGLLRADRLEHASLSFTLAAGVGLTGRSRTEALAFSFTLGFVKELRDRRHSRFDPVDLAADAIGATLGAIAATRR
jgi:hypothetical protein